MPKTASAPAGQVGVTSLECASFTLPFGNPAVDIAVVHRPDSVAVLPLRVGRVGLDVMLVRRPRPVVGDPDLIEAVSGEIAPGEYITITPHRELADEAGVAAEHWYLMAGGLPVSPGYTTERMHLLACAGITHARKSPDRAVIGTEWVPMATALRWTDYGVIQDLKTAAALHMAERLYRTEQSFRLTLGIDLMRKTSEIPRLPRELIGPDVQHRMWGETTRFVSVDPFGSQRVDMHGLAGFLAEVVNEHTEDLCSQVATLEDALTDAHSQLNDLTGDAIRSMGGDR